MDENNIVKDIRHLRRKSLPSGELSESLEDDPHCNARKVVPARIRKRRNALSHRLSRSNPELNRPEINERKEKRRYMRELSSKVRKRLSCLSIISTRATSKMKEILVKDESVRFVQEKSDMVNSLNVLDLTDESKATASEAGTSGSSEMM